MADEKKKLEEEKAENKPTREQASEAAKKINYILTFIFSAQARIAVFRAKKHATRTGR